MEIKTLNEQIERLRELIRKCYATVAGKNGTVPEIGERNMENLPAAIASTHDTLEELTITQNGEYTPQEGVDGFSKVTAEFDTSSLPKVKVVGNLTINNNCINDDGIWDGESLIDTSEISSFKDLFYRCSSLKKIDVSSWDTSNVGDIAQIFYEAKKLEEVVGFEKLDFSKVTKGFRVFFKCSNLRKINTSSLKLDGVGFTYESFYRCEKLEELDFTGIKNTSGYIDGLCSGCSSLRNWVGGRTIEDVITNDVKVLENFGQANRNTMDLRGTILDRASLRALINGLADLTGQTAQTLTFGASLIAKLTEEDIAITTSKNWTIV